MKTALLIIGIGLNIATAVAALWKHAKRRIY